MPMQVIKRNGRREKLDAEKIKKVLHWASEGLLDESEIAELEMDSRIQFYDGISTRDIHQILVKTAADKITAQTPKYNYVAARLVLFDLYKEVARNRGYKVKDDVFHYSPYKKKEFLRLIKENVESIYDPILLEKYTEEQINELAKYIKPERDYQFTYSGIMTLKHSYLLKKGNSILELPQEMYMLIAMTLASPVEDPDERVKFAKRIYDLISTFTISLATPIILNARKVHRQLSSCFVFSVNDSLRDIYSTLTRIAMVSKYSGGIGSYIGKIRSMNAGIKYVEGASSGIIPVLKLINDTMVYVNQLGSRKGSASVTLDIWHPDIFLFLRAKMNSTEERFRADDIHPAVSIPDLFLERLLKNNDFENGVLNENIEDWTLIDPKFSREIIFKDFVIPELEKDNSLESFDKIHNEPFEYKLVLKEINKLEEYVNRIENYLNLIEIEIDQEQDKVIFKVLPKGLEDFYGAEFKKYYEYIESKYGAKEIPGKIGKTSTALIWKRFLLTSMFETGEPYLFFRDTVNKLNPNKHQGMIYSSNLCHEITQNMSPTFHRFDKLSDDEDVITSKYIRGDTVVCNLASINLGKFQIPRNENGEFLYEQFDKEIEPIMLDVVKILNNVIDLNFYPVKDTEGTNHKYRAIGIGVNNYHYFLVKHEIPWESEKHIEFVDKVFESIAYFGIKASSIEAKEKGPYEYFEGSDYSKGIFFGKECSEIDGRLDWKELYEKYVKKYGMRNAYLFAQMPTGSTSVIIGSTASVDPIFDKKYNEDKSYGTLPQIPPEVDKYYWHYKSAFNIDQFWVVKAAAVRQKWIDQAQSLNLFITPENIDGYTLSKLVIEVWKQGLKTLYYIRNRSAVEICESCET